MQRWRQLVLIAGSVFAFGCSPSGNGDDGTNGSSSTPPLSCAAPTVACNGVCVQPDSDPANCGTCGVACAIGQQCRAGLCETACNLPCGALETCQAGQCVCSVGTTLCDATCVNLQTDSTHCGNCATACTNGQVCQAGACQCSAGQVTCGADCADLASSQAHCGACDNACGDIEQCVQGVCRDTRPGGDNCGGAARSIDVTKVTLSQAVEIGLFEGATAVSERNANVIAGRDALVRAFVTPRAEFSSRELSFRVYVENPDGTEPHVLQQKRVVSGSSNADSLDSTFHVVVPHEELTADTSIWVELVECAAPPSGEVGTVRLPETGSLPLDAQNTGVVKVGFVPVVHDGRTPDTSPEVLKRYTDAVLAQYPIVGVESFVTTPIESGQSGVGVELSVVLDRVRDKRAEDEPADDVYYFGLITPAADFNEYCQSACTTGVAFELTDTSEWYVSSRAGIGVGYGDDISAETFVHELGHNQGRAHAPCGVDGDPDFPYDEAAIGVWGYDLFEEELKDPSEYADFMSYCSPTWVSDYTYNAIAERVAIVNGASSSPKRVGGGEPIVWAAIRVTERGMAWTRGITTQPGDDIPAEVGVVYDAAGQALAQVDVFRVNMSENAGYLLYVPPAQPGWYAVGLPGGPTLPY